MEKDSKGKRTHLENVSEINHALENLLKVWVSSSMITKLDKKKAESMLEHDGAPTKVHMDGCPKPNQPFAHVGGTLPPVKEVCSQLRSRQGKLSVTQLSLMIRCIFTVRSLRAPAL